MADREKLVIPEHFKDRPIYSISRLKSFVNCEYSYYRTYILKDRGKDNVYSYLGSCVHDIVEDLVQNKIDKIQALAQFQSKLIESEILGLKFPSDKIKQNFIENIRLYLANFKPINVKKIIIEKEFFTEVASHVLLGYIDAITLTEDNELEIIDFKTSTKYSKKDLDDYGMQLVLYGLAIEKEYGVKAKCIKWNMLKYVKITFMGATKSREKVTERNQLINSLQSELVKDLIKEGKSNIEIEMLLEESRKINNFSLFSKEIQNKYNIEDYYIEYDYNEDTKKALEVFVETVAQQIESKPIEHEGYWFGRAITPQDNFFCGNLCGHASKCKYYLQYMQEHHELFTKEEKDKNDLVSMIFG